MTNIKRALQIHIQDLEELFDGGEVDKRKGGPVIRAEVAIKLKGRKKKPLDDEADRADRELNNMVWGNALFIFEDSDLS